MPCSQWALLRLAACATKHKAVFFPRTVLWAMLSFCRNSDTGGNIQKIIILYICLACNLILNWKQDIKAFGYFLSLLKIN